MTSSASASGINKAIQLQQSGHLDKADKIYVRILRSKPAHKEALHMRGVLKLEQGQHELAEHLLKKAAATNKSDPWVQFHLAQVYAETERHSHAIKYFEKAIESGAIEADVFYLYANSLFQKERIPDAIKNYLTALQLSPEDYQCRLNLSNAYEAAGELPRAIETLEPLATDKYSSVPIKLQFIELLINSRQARRAHRVVTEINSVAFEEIDQILSTATHLFENARYDSVAQLIDLVASRSAELNSKQLDTFIGLLNDTGQFDRSLKLLQSLHKNDNRSAWSWFQEGLCEQVAGEFLNAGRCHQKALEVDENLGSAAYALASNSSSQIDDALLASWEPKTDSSVVSEHQKAQFCFAVAKELDKREQFDSAFSFYETANALKAKTHPFDADRWDEYIENTIKTFNHDFFEQKRNLVNLDSLPDTQLGKQVCFVVGMPRSGSTLLEQRLIQSVGVVGLGEHQVLPRLYADIPEVTNFKNKPPFSAIDLEKAHIDNFRQQYIASLAPFSRQTHSTRFVDKMLGNMLRLGVIALMFPDAKILCTCRDPMATGVSCFTNTFGTGLRFTYDLYALGRAWRSYHKLMRHWHSVLPLKIMDVHYEELVSDPDNYLLAINDFLGSSNTVKKNSDESSHAVPSATGISTASFWQARQPVSTASVHAWKRFASHLDLLREGLEYDST